MEEIVLNLFKSVSNLKEPQRFYGWMWAVADNVYKTYLRQGKRQLRVVTTDTSDDGAYWPENMVLDNVDLLTQCLPDSYDYDEVLSVTREPGFDPALWLFAEQDGKMVGF